MSTAICDTKRKKLDAIKMRNIQLVEHLSIIRPSSWIEWDTWTGADATDSYNH